ncbi:MAG: glycosyltransferase [Coriobacteriia bacterium]|nr:glycosyltransferase [Coriobacteriia bacterium]
MHTSGSDGAAAPDEVRFSLIMPAYNAEATISRAIESVMAQDYRGWELIVVDDGSSDATGDIAREYARRDSRIRVLTQDNQGCASARRAGAQTARGEFVTKIDADDYLLSGALATLSESIDAQPQFDIYSAHGYREFSDGSRVDVFGDPIFSKPLSLVLDDLIDECWIFGGGASIRRKTLERIGGFRAEMRCEDYDLWLRALAAGARHRYIPARIYVWSMGVPGRMNENPIPSFQSYITILQDLIARGVITGSHVDRARAAMAKFAERIRQLEETGTTDADYTNEQARRFKDAVNRLSGKRLGGAVILAADRVKWVVKPIRVNLALRKRLKDGR